MRLASRFSNEILAAWPEDGEMNAGPADVIGNAAHVMHIVDEWEAREKAG